MNDVDFVQKCISGDSQALEDFVIQYSRLIYNYIIVILQRKNPNLNTPENIKDIFQNIFLSLIKDNFRKLRSYEGKNGCSLASWLRQVTINYAIDYMRRYRTAMCIDQVNDYESLKYLVTEDKTVIMSMLSEEERLLSLQKCIEILDIDEKFLIELHFNRGLSLGAVKELFRNSRGTIDMYKSRVISKLRKCFREKGFIVP